MTDDPCTPRNDLERPLFAALDPGWAIGLDLPAAVVQQLANRVTDANNNGPH